MNRLSIIKLTFAVPVIALALYYGYKIYNDISEKDYQYKRIAKADKLAIERLVRIREVMKLYRDVNKKYPENWDEFTTFALEGMVPITQTQEEIRKDRLGQDSVVVNIDTLSIKPAFEILQPTILCSKEEVKQLRYVPLTDGNEFELKSKAQRGPALVEVSDPDPVNPARIPDNKDGLKPLKFGSVVRSTLKGNWE